MVLTYAKDINKAKKYLNCRLQSKNYFINAAINLKDTDASRLKSFSNIEFFKYLFTKRVK